MYEIHFRKRLDTPQNFTRIGFAVTLQEARAKRVVAGDLVVEPITESPSIEFPALGRSVQIQTASDYRIVQSTEWLWCWELKDPCCYAQLAIHSGR